MRYPFLIACLFCSYIVLAQQENEQPIDSTALHSYITFDLTTPFNFGTPRYRFGFIQDLNETWKIGADLGYGAEAIALSEFGDIDGQDFQLFEARTETYWVFKRTPKVQHYLSGELFYINHTETFYNDYYYPDAMPGQIVRYSQTDYQRQKYGVHFKYGAFINIGEHLGFNIYYGLGIRVRDTEFTNVSDYLLDDEPFDEFRLFDDLYRQEGTDTGLSMTISVKFFYKF